MQKAKQALDQAAEQLSWTALERDAQFHEPVDSEGIRQPRVFILSLYSHQTRLLRALLKGDPDISARMMPNFVVRSSCSSVCVQLHVHLALPFQMSWRQGQPALGLNLLEQFQLIGC